MPAKTSNAIATDDGRAIVGGRIGASAFYRNLTSSDVPMSTDPAPVTVPSGTTLPPSAVAAAIVGREVAMLRKRAEELERFLSTPAVGAGGMQLPHVVQAQRDAREELDVVAGEIDRLSNLSDIELRQHAATVESRTDSRGNTVY